MKRLTILFILLSSNVFAYGSYDEQRRNEEQFRQTQEMRKANMINDLKYSGY